MFAVGGLDAYYCDAYTDVVAAAIISKNRYLAMVLPGFFYEIKFPIRAILEQYTNNQNWRWRMAARRMMERENVLSLDTVRSLFNRFFRDRHKFFESVASKEAFSGLPPSPFRFWQNDNRWQMPLLYPEGVAEHSPGSRSAPWDPVDPVGSTLKGL